MTNAISIFNFKSTPVRTQLMEGNIWFCLIDVCDSLQLKRNSSVISRLDEKGCRKTATLTDGGKQELNYINEPNLYRLIFRSNKPAAVQFGNWVYEEVLPSIRKTGGYGVSSLTNDRAALKAIGGMVKKWCAVAVRQELAGLMDNIIASGDNYKTVYPTSDDDLIRCLWSWYATHHKKTFDSFQRITAENDQLKCKLLTIKQAVI